VNIVRVGFVPEFDWGDDVVLLAMDSAGVDTYTTALNHAEQQGSSRLDHGGMIHEFFIEAGAADIELHDGRAVWRLDHAKAVEIIEKLTALGGGRGGHHYVDDMSTPTHALVLSRDEYVYDPPRPPVRELPPLKGSPAEPPSATGASSPSSTGDCCC
jgi:hypothetical protein